MNSVLKCVSQSLLTATTCDNRWSPRRGSTPPPGLHPPAGAPPVGAAAGDDPILLHVVVQPGLQGVKAKVSFSQFLLNHGRDNPHYE